MRGRALVLAGTLLLCLPAAPASSTGDAERGRAIYEGRTAEVNGATACVRCHRPSGLGSFEGGIAATPIAGRQLFRPYDRDTAGFFTGQRSDRIRPAYDDVSLREVLRSGVAPDGHRLHPAMPRVALDQAAAADLAQYLRSLSERPAIGVDGEVIHLATVSTPETDPARRNAMLATLREFASLRNAQPRHEHERALSAARNHEMAKDRKFRRWQLHHWALTGEPGSWPAQMAAFYAAQPVFAMLGGLGGAHWQAVDDFCRVERVPCILPLVDALPAGERGFYSLYFHGGLGVDAVVAADHLRGLGVRSVQLWSDARSAPLAAAVRAALARAGIEVHTDAPAVVSMLPVPEHLARARVDSLTPTTVWLPGNRLVARTDLDDLVRHAPHTVVVSPLRAMADASVLRRTEGWLSQRGLSVSHAEVAAAALQAATVLGDALTHIDFDFTREYVLELLEHGLENMVPYGPYPRLAIAADQREASKGSYLGRIEQGRLSWSWRPVAR